MVEFIKIITAAGGFGVLGAFTWMWLNGRIVTRRELDAAEKRAAVWQALAMRSVGNNERLQGTTERGTALVATAVDLASKAVEANRSSP